MNTRTLVCTCVAVALMSAAPFRSLAQDAAAATTNAAAQDPQAASPDAAAQDPQAAKPDAAQPVPTVRVVDSANSNEAVVSMVFDETPISDVIKAFREATGANIISGGTNLQGNVSVRLDKVPWRKGLSSILDQQGLQLVEQPAGSGIFMINAKTVEIPKVTRTFELKHAKADDVAKLFTTTLNKNGTATAFASANVVIITAPEQQIGECEAILTSIDKPRPQVYIEARFMELSALASKKLGVRWDSFGGSGLGVKFEGANLGFTDTKKSSSTRKGGNSGSGTATSTQTDTDTFENDTRSIINDLTSETILNRGNSSSFDKTESHDKTRVFTGSLSVSAFALAINAFEQLDGVSIFSNPRIIVGNEETAKIDMTTKEPNVEVNYQAATQQGQRDSVSTKLAVIPGKEEPFVGEAFFSYGITLKVTPRISPTGLITVSIMPAISDLQSYYRPSGLDESQPVSRFPIIRMKRIDTTFTMVSGTTAVIGGLSRTSTGSTDSGIPFLRKLPWIGPRLFGWKSHENEQKEIVIFVTVGIADANTMEEGVGMPKNAVLSRGVLDGKTSEPGDRTIEDLMSFKDPPRQKVQKPEDAAAQAPEEDTPVATEDPAAEKPAAEEPTAGQPETPAK